MEVEASCPGTRNRRNAASLGIGYGLSLGRAAALASKYGTQRM